MKKLTLLLVALCCPIFMFAQKNLTVQEAKMLIHKKKNLVIVDVRTPEEFRSGHLSNAVEVDYRNPNFKTEIAKLNKKKSILVYCRSGHRSAEAVKVMHELGFKYLYNMLGGYNEWKNAEK